MCLPWRRWWHANTQSTQANNQSQQMEMECFSIHQLLSNHSPLCTGETINREEVAKKCLSLRNHRWRLQHSSVKSILSDNEDVVIGENQKCPWEVVALYPGQLVLSADMGTLVVMYKKSKIEKESYKCEEMNAWMLCFSIFLRQFHPSAKIYLFQCSCPSGGGH